MVSATGHSSGPWRASQRRSSQKPAQTEPHAVVSSRPGAEYPGGGRGAWVELPAEASRGGEVCVGGDREGAVNPGLGRVLGALDEAEERLRRGALAGGC
jgi:hypothetical protein